MVKQQDRMNIMITFRAVATNTLTGALGHRKDCENGHVREQTQGVRLLPSPESQVYPVHAAAVGSIAVAFHIFGGRDGELAQLLRALAVLRGPWFPPPATTPSDSSSGSHGPQSSAPVHCGMLEGPVSFRSSAGIHGGYVFRDQENSTSPHLLPAPFP